MNRQSIGGAQPRVSIADDHPLYCDALRAVVPQACPGADIGEAASQEQVLAAIAGERAFNLILLDLNLPGATRRSCRTSSGPVQTRSSRSPRPARF